MASGDSLESKQISATYKDLLQVPNSNSGVDGTTRTIMDGEGTESALQVSTTAVKADGTFEATGATTITGALTLGSTELTSTATELNLLSGITAIDTNITDVSTSDDTLASAKSIKAYVDDQILTKDNLDEIAEGTTNKHFTSTDESKLDAIEASATADQTDAEIRTAVEAATDSNVFTDEDHSKLDAIEASATADQTGAQIKTAYEAESDTNAFTDAEKTSLGTMEDNADVTNATNVTAAGALMDNEVTNLAAVKAFDASDYATAAQGTTADDALAASAVSTFGGTLIDDTDAAAARTTLGASASGANSDITSLAGLTTDLAIAHGGTGQGTAQAAIDSLSAVSGATDEHVLTKDTSTGNAIWKEPAVGGGASTLDDLTDVTISTPASTEVLTYNGTKWVNSAASGESGGSGTVNTGADGKLAFYDGAGTAVNDAANLNWDSTNNRLGIGCVSNSAKLEVAGPIRASSISRIEADVLNSGDNTANIIYRSGTNTLVGNGNYTYITDAGNVGIGAMPTAGILHTTGTGNQAVRVECTDDNHSRLELDADRSTEGYVIGSFDGLWNGTRVGAMQVLAGADTTNKDDGVISFSTTLGGVETEAMRIASDGDVKIKEKLGIGAIPTSKFGVYGSNGNFTVDSYGQTVNFTRNGGNYILADAGSSSSLKLQGQHSLQFSTGAGQTEAMLIDSAGVVSIKSSGASDAPAKLALWATDVSIAADDSIGRIEGQGTDSGGSAPYVGGKIEFNADADWDTSTSNYYPTRIDFFTQDNTGTDTTTSSRMTIASDGNVDLAAGRLTIASSAGTDGQVLTTGGDGTIAWEDAAGGTKWDGGATDLVASTGRASLGLVIGADVQAYDADTAKTDAAQTFTKPQRASIETLSATNNVFSPDFSTSNNYYVELTSSGNWTLSNPTGLTDGQSGVITIKRGSSLSTTLAIGSFFKFESGEAPDISAGSNVYDELVYYVADATEESERIVASLLKDIS